MPVPNLTLRLVKGAPLTPGELDNNFTILKTFANGLEETVAASFDENGLLQADVVGPEQIKAAVLGDGLTRAASTDPISVNVDDATIEFDGSTPKKIRVKDDSIDFKHVKSGVPSGSHVCLTYELSSGTDGGTFTNGSWVTRPLNVTRRNQNSALVSLNSNVIRLAAGTYRCRFWATANQVDGHVARLYNSTQSTELIVGCAARADTTSGNNTASFGEGYFTVADSQDLILQHYAKATNNGDGMGRAAATGSNEVYACIEFWKES